MDDTAAPPEQPNPEGGAAGAPEGEGGETQRVLSQNEIDSLLGFDGDNPEGQENSGIMALINS
ncbi:MAG TPA: flagellar motor switch protein FliM, partial [Alphaproteobacteria bacterium]|nr:flagellar motor switch protein FliM [Alphaproteobacteria bacterium]